MFDLLCCCCLAPVLQGLGPEVVIDSAPPRKCSDRLQSGSRRGGPSTDLGALRRFKLRVVGEGWGSNWEDLRDVCARVCVCVHECVRVCVAGLGRRMITMMTDDKAGH